MIPNIEHCAPNEPDEQRFRYAYRRLRSEPQFALMELEKLASQGSILSMIHLADAYKRGEIVGIDLLKAEDYYRLAAKAGALIAYYSLGRMYLRQGRTDEALSAFNYASGKGYPPATHYLGRIYFNGMGVTRDPLRGEKLLKRAAQRGSVIAKGVLSTILMRDRTNPMRILKGIGLRLVVIAEFIATLVTEGFKSDRFR